MAMPLPLSIAACRSVGFLAEEKRWLDFSSASHCWDHRSGKVWRAVLVSATRSDWAVSNSRLSSDSQSTSYVVKEYVRNSWLAIYLRFYGFSNCKQGLVLQALWLSFMPAWLYLGDTLTSIAKKSKTTVRLLADANSIDNVDFLLSGQLLHVPSESAAYEMPAGHTVDVDEFPIRRRYNTRSSSGNSLSQQGDYPDVVGVEGLSSSRGSQREEGRRLAASVHPTPALNFLKLAVPVLLIAPLLGFCIRCIVDALYIHMDREESKQRAERETWDILHRPKAKRWQRILDEDRDGMEPEFAPAEDSPTRNVWTGGDVWTQDVTVQQKIRENIKVETDEEIRLRHKQDYEDIHKSYAELESTYAKFLADSGMSNSGYWRRSGVPTSARLDDGEPR